MHGSMGGWMSRCVGDGWLDKCIDACMDGFIAGS
jgi:hypothetical protein